MDDSRLKVQEFCQRVWTFGGGRMAAHVFAAFSPTSHKHKLTALFDGG